MPQHIFNPERENSWRGWQESVRSESEFDGFESILKIRVSGRMTTKSQVGLVDFRPDKNYDTLPLQNAVSEFELPKISFEKPSFGLEGDFFLDLQNQLVFRYTEDQWLQLPGAYYLGTTPPVNLEGTFIDTSTFIIYEADGYWKPVGNLLTSLVLQWPIVEEVTTPGGLSTRCAIPYGKKVRLGSYTLVFEPRGETTPSEDYDLLNSSAFNLPVESGGNESTRYGQWVLTDDSSVDFQENNWFTQGARTLELPLHHFDEGRLVGFWLSNPDGNFALSQIADPTASPSYRPVAVNEVLSQLSSLKLAVQAGCAWGYGQVDYLGLYLDLVTGRLYLANTLLLTIGINNVLFGSSVPGSGVGTNGDCFIVQKIDVYLKQAGSWVLKGSYSENSGVDSLGARWGFNHQHGQFSISFVPQWDADSGSFVSTVVAPSNDMVLPNIHRNYVSFWKAITGNQKIDLNDRRADLGSLDVPYAGSTLDSTLQTPYGQHYFKFNAPNPWDTVQDGFDFYQAITSSYQDLLRTGVSFAEKRYGDLSQLTFSDQLIQGPDNNWYASVHYIRDLKWPYTSTAQNWSDVQLFRWINGDPSHYEDVETSVTSGVLVSRLIDDADPITIQAQASCNYKTTLSLAPGFFSGMTSLDWENATEILR